MNGKDTTGRTEAGKAEAGRTTSGGAARRTYKPQGGRILTDAMWDTMKAIIGRVDAVADSMELKWGIGRLPTLVPQEWAEKFYSQVRKFHNAVQQGSPADVQIEAERMITAWTYLDSLATKDGKPQIGSACPVIERLGPEGVVWMVVSGPEEAHWLAKWLKSTGDTRKVQIWAVDELARLAGSIPAIGAISKAKEVFGEAVVESVRVPVADGMASFINDEIPF